MELDQPKREVSKALDDKKGLQIDGVFNEAQVANLKKRASALQVEVDELEEKKKSLEKGISDKDAAILHQLSTEKESIRADRVETTRMRTEAQNELGLAQQDRSNALSITRSLEKLKEDLQGKANRIKEIVKELA